MRLETFDPAKLAKGCGSVQARAEFRHFVQSDYCEAILAGAEFPPILLFRDAAGDLWLADGAHRLGAAIRAECPEIEAEVRSGSREDAVRYAVGANASHGLQRTGSDKRRAVELALTLPEADGMSDREIAKLCAVSNTLVSEIRNPPSKVTVPIPAKVKAAERMSTVDKRKPLDTPKAKEPIAPVQDKPKPSCSRCAEQDAKVVALTAEVARLTALVTQLQARPGALRPTMPTVGPTVLPSAFSAGPVAPDLTAPVKTQFKGGGSAGKGRQRTMGRRDGPPVYGRRCDEGD